ncbi:MAG TPA: hypothetical protein PK883_06050 [Anaerolineaceae bacterium]|nr:hypothetical protein [Anaerolineaceae bacterium]
MKPESGLAKVLRFVGILFMSLTAAFTVMGGVGTSCAALFPTKWDSMAPLAPFQWLYILYVLVTTAIGVLGIRAVIALVKGRKGAYKSALIALVLGLVVGLVHILTSRALRGSSMPVDAVVYITVLTLVIFLIFRIPAIWAGVDYEKAPRKEGKKNAGGAAIVVGVLCLTIQFFMAPTHTWGGVNYADAFHATMTIVGGALTLLGSGLLISDLIMIKKTVAEPAK